jgi:hypothetical protein
LDYQKAVTLIKKPPKNSLINIAIFALGYVSFSGKIDSGMDTGAFMGWCGIKKVDILFSRIS